MLIKDGKVPIVQPLNFKAFIRKADGEPDIAAVDGVVGAPYIEHDNEGIVFCANGKYEGTLGAEGLFGAQPVGRVGSETGITQFLPWPPN